MTAIVHLANSIWKVILNHRSFNKEVLIKFGFFSLLFGIFGACLLEYLAQRNVVLYETYFFHTSRQVDVLSFLMGILLLIFAILEFQNKLLFTRVPLWIGGVISGFFGGLSGHQGALRTAFLVKRIPSKEMLISTTAIISLVTDMGRLSIYGLTLSHNHVDSTLLILCIIMAFFGVWLGTKFLKKVTYDALKRIIASGLFLLALSMIMGLV